MIALDRVRACSNPECREILPADPAEPALAGFYVNRRRPDGSVVGFASRCKPCSARARRGERPTWTQRVHVEMLEGVERRVKFCVGCSGTKVAEDGASDSGFYVAQRWDGYVTFYRLCKVCTRAERQKRYREDPVFAERQKQARERWTERNWEQNRATKLAWLAKYRQEHRERYNEMCRMAYHLRRQRAGLPSRPRRLAVIDGTRPEVPVAPFMEWLETYRHARGLDIPGLALDLVLNERRVRGLLAGENRSVSVDVVSRALTEAGCVIEVDGRVVVTFDDLYPGVSLREKRRKPESPERVAEYRARRRTRRKQKS